MTLNIQNIYQEILKWRFVLEICFAPGYKKHFLELDWTSKHSVWTQWKLSISCVWIRHMIHFLESFLILNFLLIEASFCTCFSWTLIMCTPRRLKHSSSQNFDLSQVHPVHRLQSWSTMLEIPDLLVKCRFLFVISSIFLTFLKILISFKYFYIVMFVIFAIFTEKLLDPKSQLRSLGPLLCSCPPIVFFSVKDA